jgi:hypothetical protein
MPHIFCQILNEFVMFRSVSRKPQYKISWKSVHWLSCWQMSTDRYNESKSHFSRIGWKRLKVNFTEAGGIWVIFCMCWGQKKAFIFVRCLNSWLLLTFHWLSVKLYLFCSHSFRILDAFSLDAKSGSQIRYIWRSAFISTASSRRISMKFGSVAFLKPPQ